MGLSVHTRWTTLLGRQRDEATRHIKDPVSGTGTASVPRRDLIRPLAVRGSKKCSYTSGRISAGAARFAGKLRRLRCWIVSRIYDLRRGAGLNNLREESSNDRKHRRQARACRVQSSPLMWRKSFGARPIIVHNVPKHCMGVTYLSPNGPQVLEQHRKEWAQGAQLFSVGPRGKT